MNRTPVEDALAGALRTLDAPVLADDLFACVHQAVRRRTRRRRAVGAGVLAAVLAVSLGPVALDTGRGEPTDAAVAVDAVEVLRAGIPAGGSWARPWSTLRGVLPNVSYSSGSAGQQVREKVTDSVVVGRVVRTEPAYGMLGEPLVAGEDVRTRVIAFDDPRAAWRFLSVTVDVSEALAGAPTAELVIQWLVPGPSGRGPDARAVGRALADLGTIVVLSKASPSRPEFVPGRTPLPAGYGIGRVNADGRLDFPLLEPHEGPGGAVFMDSIDTLQELRDGVQEPDSAEVVEPAAP